MTLPDEAQARKSIPLATGFADYFPSAIVAVAALSAKGNDQHNPGAPLHWDREKSGDEADALFRHFLQRGTVDGDGVLHSTKVAWRALAMLQKELEASGAPIAPGAKNVPKGKPFPDTLGPIYALSADDPKLEARLAKQDDDPEPSSFGLNIGTATGFQPYGTSSDTALHALGEDAE